MDLIIYNPDGTQAGIKNITAEQLPEIISAGVVVHGNTPLQVTNFQKEGSDMSCTIIGDFEEPTESVKVVDYAEVEQRIAAPRTEKIVDSTLSQRGESYGDAWKLTGQFLSEVITKYNISLSPLMASGYMYNWMSIMSKLLRALTSPRKRDHWVDIAGYATLVANDLEEE